MLGVGEHVDGLHGGDAVFAVEQRQVARLRGRIATYIHYSFRFGGENHVDYIGVHAGAWRVDYHHVGTAVTLDELKKENVAATA